MNALLYIASACAFYFVLKRTLGEWGKPVAERPTKYLALLAAAAGAALVLGLPYLGARTPGSLFERADYEARLFVYLFPAPERSPSYRVPALVESVVNSETDQNEDNHVWREYWLRYAVMPNGGTIRFHDCSLARHKLNRCVDDNLHSWGIRLTSDAAP